MTKKENIINYLAENGLDIRPYIYELDYQRPGTIVIRSVDMFGYGGDYSKWRQLNKIVSAWDCPVEMHKIRSRHPGYGSGLDSGFRHLTNYDRLVWNERKNSHD